MTVATLQRSVPRRRRMVGGRRPIVRWAWRMFQREWRQQVVVMLLLTVTVAAAVLAAIAAYNTVPSPGRHLGEADYRIDLDSTSTDALDRQLDSLEQRFAPIEVIGHRTERAPGSVDNIDVRAQRPDGVYGSPLLRLVSGRFPVADGEVALTDHVATLLDAAVGSTATLGRQHVTVVGLVENPRDLDDEFALVPPAAHGAGAGATGATVLVRGHHDVLHIGSNSIRQFQTIERDVTGSWRGREDGERGPIAVLVLSLDTVVMLLVALVAAASFVVVAQRRLRQFGMLSATGASGRQIRLVVLAHAFAVGAVAAVAGNAIAVAAWLPLSSRLESAAGHRIDMWSIPWWMLLAGAALALITTCAAAWWPARTVQRVPVVVALGGRPPRPRGSRRSLIVALVLYAAGLTALVVGIDGRGEARAQYIIAAPIAVVLAILFVVPSAVGALGRLARHLPVGARVALRDISRQRARTASAVAAISLALGIAMTAVIVTTAAAPAANSGNLSNRQLLFRLGDDKWTLLPLITAQDSDRMTADVDSFVAGLEGPVVHDLEVAVVSSEPVTNPFGVTGLPVVGAGELVDHGVSIVRDIGTAYVATPDLLALAHVGSVDPSVDLITASKRILTMFDEGGMMHGERPDLSPARVQRIASPPFSSMPRTFVSQQAMSSHHWTAHRTGWFIETKKPLTAKQRADARRLAARWGMTVETRDAQRGLLITRNVATAAGLLLALAILAMSLGLIRSEAARDLRTLTATGASRRVRRTISAATAAALTGLAALLGLVGAYGALIAGYSDHLHPLSHVPVRHLVLIVIGLPVLSAVVAWLISGREPVELGRQPLD